MARKKCPVCGEKYSDTYRDCPFCEEENAMRDGDEIRRTGRRVAHGRQYSLMTPTLVILILIMVALLVYLLYGDKLAEKWGKGDDQTENPGIEQEDPKKEEDPQQPGNPIKPVDPSQSGTMPEDPGTTTTPVTPTPNKNAYDEAYKLPSGLFDVMNREDFTLAGAGDSWVLKSKNATGNYTWISQDESIATVDSNGKVTAVSGGKTIVLVTDGSFKSTCDVHVRGPVAPSTGEDVYVGEGHKLNREDITLAVGESFRLKVSGLTTGLTWTIDKTNVATISDNGTVTGMGKGRADVTVTWDGGSDTCIIRVSG